jgi:hypothetical protein
MLRDQAGIHNEVRNVRVECNKDHSDRMTAGSAARSVGR